MRSPEVGEISLEGIGMAAKEQADENEGDEGKGLGGSKDVLDKLADLQTARVDEREQDDNEDSH